MPKILIVEDETPLALMMALLLSRLGCDVTVARTGQEGLELAVRQPFDLITLDVDLPDSSGFDICRELKQRHISCQPPIVFVSGRFQAEDRQLALELGAADFIEKPFDPQDFLARILSLVEETALT